MPTINLPEKKKYQRFKESSKKDNLNHKCYNTSAWRELRISYLMQHPLCEKCLEICHLRSAIDVHHKKPLSTGATLEEKQLLCLDENNLMSLCKECHKEIHKSMYLW